jgi:NAD-dependent deacetylase
MEKSVPQFTLITQNIDGLHKTAGSRNIIELHGNIQRTKCSNENIVVDTWEDTGEIPPRCPGCGGYLRPDVVWFGEMLSPKNLTEAQFAAKNCDFFFSIGTSGLVEPAASLPFIALGSGATLIEVNTQETPISRYANYVFRQVAGIILPQIYSQVWDSTFQKLV